MNEELEMYDEYCKKVRRNTMIFIFITVASIVVANFVNNEIFDKVIIGLIIVLTVIHHILSNDKQYKKLDQEYIEVINWWHNKSVGERIMMFRNKVN